MPAHSASKNQSAGWEGLKRGNKSRLGEWIAERLIFFVSLSAIVMVFLIFLFVAREALPVALGRTDSSFATKAILPEQMDKMSQAELMEYLDLTPGQFAQMDKETLKELMKVKVEAAAEAPKDRASAASRARDVVMSGSS